MRILVAYDGTLNSKDALRYGLFQAKRTSGDLHVLNALNVGALVEYEGLMAEETAQREMAVYLRDAEDIIAESGRGVMVSFITAEGALETELMGYARLKRVDLIIVPEQFAALGSKAPCRVSVVPRDFSTFKVLIVDDELAFANTLSQRLSLRNLKTDVVSSGEDATEYVANEAPDIMILDLRMPGMDGIEVLGTIKRTEPQIQIIILTGRESRRDWQQAMELGAFDFMNKPVNIDSLAGKIKEAYWTKIEQSPQSFVAAEDD